jgi:hypothetical protein
MNYYVAITVNGGDDKTIDTSFDNKQDAISYLRDLKRIYLARPYNELHSHGEGSFFKVNDGSDVIEFRILKDEEL